MIREINGFTYFVHLLDKHCFEITYRKKDDEMCQTKKTFIYRFTLSVNSENRRNIVYKDFVLVQEENKEFDFLKCFDNNLEKFDASFDVYNEKVEEIRIECEDIICSKDNDTIECLDTNYLNTVLFAPYFKEKNVFILNYLDEQIEEISKELK